VGVPVGVLAAAVAVVVGGGAAFAYVRVHAVRQWLAFCVFAPALFVFLFLVGSPTADLLGGQDVAAADVAEAETPRSVVVIVWDEWPLMSIIDEQGEIDADLYPNLAALAGDGAFFRNASTTATATPYASPSIVTGRYPTGEMVSPLANEHPESIFTLLASQYDLEANESVTRLCPPNLCDGEFVDHPDAPTAVDEPSDGDDGSGDGALGALLGEAPDVFRSMVSPFAEGSIAAFDEAAFVVTEPDPEADPDPVGPDVDDAVEEATHFGEEGTGAEELNTSFGLTSVDRVIAAIEENEGPTLHYAHVQMPHAPYQYLPSRQIYQEPADEARREIDEHTVGSRPAQQAAVDLAHQRMLLQVGYADALVGDVVERLRETGLYDDTVVVMTSDHGAGFVRGQTIRALGNTTPLDESLYGDVLYVPLIIKGPGLEPGTVSDANVSIIDIVPTVAEMIGVDIPWEVDGISLVSGERTTDEKRFHLVTMTASDGRVTNPIGPVVTFDGGRFQNDALGHHVGTLLRGDNPEFAFYDVDDAGELVGRDVAELAAGSSEPSDASATVRDLDSWRSVDLAARVPAHLRASIVGLDGEAPVTIAVSLNGRIAAVGPTWTTSSEPHHFEAMLAPSLLRAGENVVELWVVEGVEGSRTLRPVAVG
jgi:hypothetical protein